MRRKSGLWLTFIAVATMASILVVVAAWPSERVGASEVDVHRNSEFIGTFRAADAIDEVSDMVGFGVRAPRRIPANYELRDARAEIGTTGLPAVPPPRSFLLYSTQEADSSERSTIQFEQRRLAERLGAPAMPVDLGLPGVEVYFAESRSGAQVYSLTDGVDGILVTMMGPRLPDRLETIEMLRSLFE